MPKNNRPAQPRPRLTRGVFSSHSVEWSTPGDIYHWLDEQFHFELDVCATRHNHKCPRYFTRETDGLAQSWAGACFMNPPYRVIEPWMQKAVASARNGATVVCLIPVRSDTVWWHDTIPYAAEVWLLNGRLSFTKHDSRGNPVEGTSNAAFPCAVVVFRPDPPAEGPVYRLVTPPGRRRRRCRAARPAA